MITTAELIKKLKSMGLQVSRQTLCKYKELGLIESFKRSCAGGRRGVRCYYSRAQYKKVLRVRKLIKNGFTLAKIKEIIDG